MTHNVGHLIICLFAIYRYSLVRYLLKSLAHFLMGYVCFLTVEFKSSLNILNNSSLCVLKKLLFASPFIRK